MTCEELLADIAACDATIDASDATITACNATITAANSVKTAAQMQKWYDQYNYNLQGCGGSGLAQVGETDKDADDRFRKFLSDRMSEAKAEYDKAAKRLVEVLNSSK